MDKFAVVIQNDVRRKYALGAGLTVVDELCKACQLRAAANLVDAIHLRRRCDCLAIPGCAHFQRHGNRPLRLSDLNRQRLVLELFVALRRDGVGVLARGQRIGLAAVLRGLHPGVFAV